MNWTGGHLSRRSRGGATAALNQRQKEHFAKAQNNLRNGTKKRSSIKGSIFGNIHVQQAHRERQPSVEPREYREASLPIPSSRSQYISDQINLERQPERSHKLRHTQQPTTRSLLKQDYTRNDDLYSATPPSAATRKRDASRHTVYDEEVDFIEKKRQRLLEKGDWVGITYQRPLRMTFASPRHSDNIGRRRKVMDGHQARYAIRQSTLISPFAARIRHYSPQDANTRSHEEKTSIQIHIGDRIKKHSISSNTTRSRRTRGRSTSRSIRDQPRLPSSEVMLLDNHEVLQSLSSQGVHETSFDDQGAEFNGLSRRGGSPYSCNGYADEVDYDGYEPGGNEQFSGEEDHQSAGGESYSAEERISSMQGDTRQLLSKHTVSPILGTPFSPSLIKHPMPQSSRVSSILRSGSSLTVESNVAQVGKAKPIVPSSQILDDEIWETWIASLYSKEPLQGQSEQGKAVQEGSISPGVSTAPTRQIKRPAPKLYQKQATDIEAEDSDEVNSASRMVKPSILTFSFMEDDIESRVPPRKVIRREPEDGKRTRKVEGLPAKSLKRKSLRVPELPTKHIKAAVEIPMDKSGLAPGCPLTATFSNFVGRDAEDPDDAWRKFVFGSEGTNDIGHISGPSQSLGGIDQSDVASAVHGKPPTGRNANSLTYTERQNQKTSRRSSSGRKFRTPSTVWRAEVSSTDIPWDPPKGVRVTARTSTVDDNASSYTPEHTLQSFNADLAPDFGGSVSTDWVASSMAVIASSHSGDSKSWDTPPSPRPRRITFTRPRRYEGSKVVLESPPAQEQHLHIRSGLR